MIGAVPYAISRRLLRSGRAAPAAPLGELGDQHVDQGRSGGEELDLVTLDRVDHCRRLEPGVDIDRARGEQRLQALAKSAEME